MAEKNINSNGVLRQFCKVHSCVEVAEKTFILSFISNEIALSAKPGQFVNILAAENGKGPLLRRPFSISRVEENINEILFSVVGMGTKLLSQKKSGDVIDVMGPLGNPFKIDSEYDTAVIVAGGIGIAPFPFLTADLQKRNKKIETLAGFRNAGQIYIEHLINVHVATDDGSRGFHGTVVQELESFLSSENLGKIKIFGCGPTAMLKSLSELSKNKKICCEVSLEGHMACGIGICQGCPVERRGNGSKYALTCKEGPVFNTTEISL